MNESNKWHKNMYDKWFASSTLNSPELLQQAINESQFIVNKTKLKKNSLILDVPCGTGRHAVSLANRGHLVTAIDISKDCIKIAKKENNHKLVNFSIGDMANLKKHYEEFDLTLNLFSSFGYFQTDQENEATLKEMYKTLKPGGQLCLQTINRDWLLTIFTKNGWSENKAEFILQERDYNSKTFYNTNRMIVINKKSGKSKEYYHRIRLYSKDELVKLIKKVGFKKVQVFGSEKGEKFSKLKSARPYYFAKK